MLKKRNLIFLSLLILGVFLITGCWLISTPTYTVTFDSQGGNVVDPQTVERGGLVIEPTAPTKADYTFAGWYKELECTNAWDFATDTVTSDVTLYAKWATNTYTVTFDSRGGSAVSSQTVEHGGKVTKPTNPTRTGYTFGGWYKESGCTNAWNFTTDTVTTNVTLYAKWTINSYTVTYDSNGSTGGTVPTDANNYEQGDSVTVLGNTGNLVKTQDGISLLFTGWNTAADGSGTSYNEADTFNIGSANVTLFAQWSVIRGTGPAGGLIFYDKGDVSDGWRYLEAAPSSTEWSGIEWGSYATLIGGTETGIGTGKSNTTTIVTWLNNNSELDRAAQLCVGLNEGGYSDWFLPSKEELNLVYTNLKVFGVGGFAVDYYWSSSEFSAGLAWYQYFYFGFQSYYSKNGTFRVRAVRAFRSTAPTYIVNYNANGATEGTVPSDGYHYEPGEIVMVLGKGDLVKTQDGISLLFEGWNIAADGSGNGGTDYNEPDTFNMGTENVTLYAQWSDSVIRGTGPAGGLIFYDKGSYSGSPSWRYLEAAPVTTEWTYKQWGSYGTLIGGTETGIGTGKVNTDLIVAAISGETDRAAQLCDALDYGGYSDWFLPSKDELNWMYTNLKVAGVGGFAGDQYWSSSEFNASAALSQSFGLGDQSNWVKNTSFRVRAVRAF